MQIDASLRRAADLLGAMGPDGAVVVKLIEPGAGCACEDCWPRTWSSINDRLAEAGPVPHEGDALVSIGGERLVLESHESGPEIIAFLNVATAAASLAAAITALATAVITARRDSGDPPPRSLKVRITNSKRGGIFEQNTAIELDVPLTGDIEKALLGHIESAVKRHT